jgi:hypothetical protein
MQQRQQQKLPQPACCALGHLDQLVSKFFMPSCNQSGHMPQQLAQQHAEAAGLEYAASTVKKQ